MDRLARLGGYREDLVVPLRALDHLHKPAVARPAHELGFGLALICEDIVHCRVRVLRHRDQIFAGIVDIGAPAVRVKRAQRLFAHDQLYPLVLARLDRPCLVKARQFHGRRFHIDFQAVLAVRLLHIELDDLPAFPVTRIVDVGRDLVSLFAGRHLHVPELEGRVGEAVAEGIRHFLVIVEIAPRRCAEHGVFVPGLIVPVPDINALLVDQVFPAVLRLAVPHGIISEVRCRRRAETVVRKCIRKAA